MKNIRKNVLILSVMLTFSAWGEKLSVEDAMIHAETILNSCNSQQTFKTEAWGNIQAKIIQKTINHQIDTEVIENIVAQELQQASSSPSLIQLEVIEQTENDCGWRALFNIWAIQQLKKEGQPITSENVRKKSSEQEKYISCVLQQRDVSCTVAGKTKKISTKNVHTYELQIEDIESINKELNLKLHNTYYIQYAPIYESIPAGRDAAGKVIIKSVLKKHDIVCMGILGRNPEDNVEQVPELFKSAINEIVKKRQKEAYFMFNTGGHWVMAAYVDGLLYYADSLHNKKLIKGNPAYDGMQALQNLLYQTPAAPLSGQNIGPSSVPASSAARPSVKNLIKKFEPIAK